jgi:hypothetical protein
VKLSQVKRLKTFCLRSVTLGEKKYKKKKLRRIKIRLHPNIVLLTLALRTVRILTCVCSYPSR